MSKKLLYSSLFILVVLLGLITCKKDKLKGDLAIFEGRWEFIYSARSNSYSGNTSKDTLYASEVTNKYEMEFLKKGKLIFYENGVETDKFRTVFSDWIHENDFSYIYIYRNNKAKPTKEIVAWFSGRDTLYISVYPFKNSGSENLNCSSGADWCYHRNCFVRKK